jgi:hypothetical protein
MIFHSPLYRSTGRSIMHASCETTWLVGSLTNTPCRHVQLMVQVLARAPVQLRVSCEIGIRLKIHQTGQKMTLEAPAARSPLLLLSAWFTGYLVVFYFYSCHISFFLSLTHYSFSNRL